MTISLSELKGRPVLDLSSATTVAHIGSGILDPSRAAVAGFRLNKSTGPGDVLPWEAIKAVGPDAITVESASNLRSATGRAEQRAVEMSIDPVGMQIITEQGRAIGDALDLQIDESTGNLERLVLSDQQLDGTSLLGIGDYAIIVSEAGS